MPTAFTSDEDVRPALTLSNRKRQMVRDQIWNTAIDLFAEKGFDETTVDDIARMAGVSQRTFFRYFSSKSDLLAQNMRKYGDLLAEAIHACPRTCSRAEVLRRTVLQVAQYVAAQSSTRKIIEISATYPAAREAQMSRGAEVQDMVATAFARRSRNAKPGDLTPKILARLSLLMIEIALESWFDDSQKDIATTVRQVLTTVGDAVEDVSTS